MSQDPASVERARELLKQLWQRHKDSVFERVAAFEDACKNAAQLDSAGLVEARNVAHKLAGSLGTFGFQEGTALARDAESIFESASISADDQQRLTDNARKIRQLLETEGA